jgi:hypothetical protein
MKIWIIAVLLLGMNSSILSQQKILSVSVDKNGQVYMGRDTLSLDRLPSEIQERLFKSYLGTGRMYDQIQFQRMGDVLPTIIHATTEAIKEGQAKALREYCVSKYSAPFDKLNNNQQNKVRKNYPVLFQDL